MLRLNLRCVSFDKNKIVINVENIKRSDVVDMINISKIIWGENFVIETVFEGGDIPMKEQEAKEYEILKNKGYESKIVQKILKFCPEATISKISIINKEDL